jgi:acyl dehydratase
MPIDPVVAGRSFPPTEPVQITQAAIDRFADSLGAPTGGAAPPTFAFTLVVDAWQPMFDDPQVDIELRRLVHADQRFTATRALRAGDQIVASATLTSVRPLPGSDRLVVDTTLASTDGTIVATATSVLMCAHATQGR